MMEYLANVYNAEKIRQYQERLCPSQYCRDEYRDERPCGKPIPLRNV
jgi:hypothetical protein